MTTAWTADHVSNIDSTSGSLVPLIQQVDRSVLAEGRIYWDMWPIQDVNGFIARIGQRELWMALAAPDRGDPAQRHFEAKIRLIERRDNRWIDLGDVLPDFLIDYEREWAGSAVKTGDTVRLYFTAAGTTKRPRGYQQRLFESHGVIDGEGNLSGWSYPCPSVAQPSKFYMPASAHEGEAGKIKAFRDPAYFRDPADGQEYLIFTASLAGASSEFNGAIGIARKGHSSWELLPPLLHADGVNNELERAHVVFHRGLYYVFWATQGATFVPGLRHAPNGLYGMVSDRLFGEYRPLNDTGLVLANPQEEPFQTYSWFVSAELQVSSFVDFWGLEGRPVPSDPAAAAVAFGGVPAPLLRLEAEGDRCTLIEMAS